MTGSREGFQEDVRTGCVQTLNDITGDVLLARGAQRIGQGGLPDLLFDLARTVGDGHYDGVQAVIPAFVPPFHGYVFLKSGTMSHYRHVSPPALNNPLPNNIKPHRVYYCNFLAETDNSVIKARDDEEISEITAPSVRLPIDVYWLPSPDRAQF